MEELLELEDIINGPTHPTKHPQLGQAWETIHDHMQIALRTPPHRPSENKPQPYSMPTRKHTDNKQNQIRPTVKHLPKVVQVFKHQLANLITPKESRTPLRVGVNIETREAPEVGREVDLKMSKGRVRSTHKKDKSKDEKHGIFTDEIGGEPKKTDLDNNRQQKEYSKTSPLSKKQTKPSSEYRIHKSKTEHIQNNVFQQSPQLYPQNPNRINIMIDRSKSLPQFVHPSEPFRSKAATPIHANYFQKTELLCYGASNNVISQSRLKLASLNHSKEKAGSSNIQSKQKIGENGEFNRLYQKRYRVLSNGTHGSRKQDFRGHVLPEKKDWLRIDPWPMG